MKIARRSKKTLFVYLNSSLPLHFSSALARLTLQMRALNDAIKQPV